MIIESEESLARRRAARRDKTSARVTKFTFNSKETSQEKADYLKGLALVSKPGGYFDPSR